MRPDHRSVAAVVLSLLVGLGACTAGTGEPAPTAPGGPAPSVSSAPAPPSSASPAAAAVTVGPMTRVWTTERGTPAWPAEMTIDPQGGVWVREMGAMTITKISPDGGKLLSAGGLGTTNGMFDFHGRVHMFEGGIAASLAGEVAVADGTPRVQVFDLDGRLVRRWEPAPARRKVAVTGMNFGPSGALYTTRSERVEVYGPTGDLLRTWGDRGPRKARLRDPDAIAVDADEHVYVADEATGRVTKFDRDGRVLAAWGRHGTGDGEFGGEGTFIDMAVGKHSVYVVDKHNGRVQRFSPSGTFLGAWSSGGQDLGSFNPGGVAVDAQDAVYVAENDLGRVVKFRVT